MHIDEEGKRGPLPTVQVNPPWHRPHDADRLTAKRTVHGIALSCLPADSPASSPALSPGVVADLCVVDAGQAKHLRSMSGRLLSACLVDELMTEENGVRILKPISLTFDNTHSAVLSGPLR